MKRFVVAVCAALALVVAAVDKGCDHTGINDIKNSNVYNIYHHANNYKERHSTCYDDQGIPYGC
jgi:hypothetical protein